MCQYYEHIPAWTAVAPKLHRVLQLRAHVLLLLVEGWLGGDDPAVLVVQRRVLNDL